MQKVDDSVEAVVIEESKITTTVLEETTQANEEAGPNEPVSEIFK